ncbi:TrmH family RNA methyltransferase [Streptococcus macacae]|uniref:RNA methyltransferase, TrmH family n=1 Tax=Streptococcus macacae NCTC 11558 TaxID=764298 RepID=G5JY67_9STRE|nr:RNA methyltransferase [Streptococcus macacae]EHJ51717.1 RNA methyltransferase, TrmH family [Streptococcus macacae NCTC 11558]SUN77982.1 rRNA methylase [Streptococcus macacae NCTC 11558]
MTIITSKSNSLLKKTKKLLRKKYRKHSYLIEGWHLFEEAQRSHAAILRIFVTEDLASKVKQLPNVFIVKEELLKDLSESKTPQGIIAEIAFPKWEMELALKGRFLVLEDVQDPGNVGTMIRTADAAGFDAVFISEKTADIYNQKTLRSMQGSHFHLPIYRVSVLNTIKDLQDSGVQIIATTLAKNSVNYKTITAPESFALVMGNEGQGISLEMAQAADVLAHIGMPGKAESLNVAVAAGIFLFSFI